MLMLSLNKKLIILASLLLCPPPSQARLLAHGHYLKNTNEIDICPNPNKCRLNPKKPLYLVWAKNTALPSLKLQPQPSLPDLTAIQSKVSVEMQRPYRLNVWEKFTPALRARIQESFIGPMIQSQDVIITSFTLGDMVKDCGDHILWFVDANTGTRYETTITCFDTRPIKKFWKQKRVCTWSK